MKLLERLVRPDPVQESRYSWQDYVNDVITFQGWQYQGGTLTGSKPEMPDGSFGDVINKIHRQNGIVAAAVHARSLPMSQLHPRWRQIDGDNAGELSTGRGLIPLTRPAGGTRGRFFKLLETDASYSGSGYIVRDQRQLRRLLPDRCGVVLGSDSDPEWDADGDLKVPYDAEVIALLYYPNGYMRGPATIFLPDEFRIYSPEPDPVYFWRGTSWVSSVVREVVIDNQMLDHQGKFFEHAATPNLVFMMDPTKSPEETRQFADVTNRLHSGPGNAYKNMFLGGGTDVKVVGSTLNDLNLKDLTGGMETRVALRSRVPGVILGIREGYAGSSLNASNYGMARRMFADGWFSPTADELMETIGGLLNAPDGKELAYDPDRVLLLQEDRTDAADILSKQASTMRSLVDGGWQPDSVRDAVVRGNLHAVEHTGKLTVQLQDVDQDGDPASDTEGDSDDEGSEN